MKLIDLQYYAVKLNAYKVYLNHKNWLEILKEKGYIDKIYEGCDYYCILPDVSVYSVVNTYDYEYDFARFVSEIEGDKYHVRSDYLHVLPYEERIIKDIIE